MFSLLAVPKKREFVTLGDNHGGLGPVLDFIPQYFPPGFARKAILVLIMVLPFGADACGWWGDGEMNREQLLAGIESGGRQIPLYLDRDSIKLPGSLGYGMAIAEPGQAQPYLQSTYGRPIGSIEDLSAYGFRAIIDLGPLAGHRPGEYPEGSAQRMRYHHLPVESAIPGQIRVAGFRDLLLDADNLPALVVAPAAEVLAFMWAAYRLEFGAPLAYAIAEARLMGLRPEQEAALGAR